MKAYEERKIEVPAKFTLPLPFPQWFKKHNLDAQYKKFLNMFRQLHINIPFVESLEHMPSYSTFMKDVFSRKKKFGEFETVALTEECSAILRKKFHHKMQDPGRFTILCEIEKKFSGHALCDLGDSVNLIPL